MQFNLGVDEICSISQDIPFELVVPEISSAIEQRDYPENELYECINQFNVGFSFPFTPNQTYQRAVP